MNFGASKKQGKEGPCEGKMGKVLLGRSNRP